MAEKKNSGWMCPYCPQSFKSAGKLQKHIRKDHPNK